MNLKAWSSTDIMFLLLHTKSWANSKDSEKKQLLLKMRRWHKHTHTKTIFKQRVGSVITSCLYLVVFRLQQLNWSTACSVTREAVRWAVVLMEFCVIVCGIVAPQRSMAWLPSRMTVRSRSWRWVTAPQRRARPSPSWAALSRRANRISASPCSRKVPPAF